MIVDGLTIPSSGTRLRKENGVPRTPATASGQQARDHSENVSTESQLAGVTCAKKLGRAFCFFAAFLFGLSVLMCPIAYACFAPTSYTTIFFDEQDLNAGIDGPAIARVAIITLTDVFVGIARVDKIIKGPIDRDKIVIRPDAPSFCTGGLSVGASGIVVGTLERNTRGELTLIARQESMEQSFDRRKAHSLPAR